MSNLVRKKVRYKTKSGKTGLRSVMVRAADAGKRVYKVAAKNKGKVALGVAALGAAALMHKHRGAIGEHATAFRRGVGAKLGESVIKTGGAKVLERLAEHHGGNAGEKIGHYFGGEFGGMVGRVLGEHTTSFLAEHYSKPHLERAGKAVAKRMRAK